MSNSLPSLRNIPCIFILQLMKFCYNVVGIILEDSASLICRDDNYFIVTKVRVKSLLIGYEIMISGQMAISKVSCGVPWELRRTVPNDLFTEVDKASDACCQSPSRCQSNQMPVASKECQVKLMNRNLKTFKISPNLTPLSSLLLLPPP